MAKLLTVRARGCCIGCFFIDDFLKVFGGYLVWFDGGWDMGWAERWVDSGRLGKVLSPACGDLALMEMRVSLGWAGGDPPVLTSLMTREKSPFPLALAICQRMVGKQLQLYLKPRTTAASSYFYFLIDEKYVRHFI